MNKLILTLAIVFILVSCSEKKEPVIQSDLELKMNNIAEDYVKLVLNIGQYDADFVDSHLLHASRLWSDVVVSS